MDELNETLKQHPVWLGTIHVTTKQNAWKYVTTGSETGFCHLQLTDHPMLLNAELSGLATMLNFELTRGHLPRAQRPRDPATVHSRPSRPSCFPYCASSWQWWPTAHNDNPWKSSVALRWRTCVASRWTCDSSMSWWRNIFWMTSPKQL